MDMEYGRPLYWHTKVDGKWLVYSESQTDYGAFQGSTTTCKGAFNSEEEAQRKIQSYEDLWDSAEEFHRSSEDLERNPPSER